MKPAFADLPPYLPCVRRVIPFRDGRRQFRFDDRQVLSASAVFQQRELFPGGLQFRGSEFYVPLEILRVQPKKRVARMERVAYVCADFRQGASHTKCQCADPIGLDDGRKGRRRGSWGWKFRGLNELRSLRVLGSLNMLRSLNVPGSLHVLSSLNVLGAQCLAQFPASPSQQEEQRHPNARLKNAPFHVWSPSFLKSHCD